ncbi:hypothetical protein BKA65DRAFT_591900 [Rhexocercosporidium sp. MPI-PUGE-AT-0058]|nr:hypothetical protein BKA65DRAFT_591900 [Rhexocercosporidium sp. MPI-PUGE-AT-0058]
MSTPVQSPTHQPAPPTEFHLFSSLPLEIRMRIYTFSLPPPRLIPLVYTPPSTTIRPHQSDQLHQSHQQQDLQSNAQSKPQPRPVITHRTIAISHTPTPPPALLHTTHESRVYIQAHYQPCLPLSGLSSPTFSPPLSQDLFPPQHQQLYNPTSDILHLPPLPGYNASFKNFTSIHTLADRSAMKQIRRLAVSEDVFLEEEKRRWKRVKLADSKEVAGFGNGYGKGSVKSSARGVVLKDGKGRGGIDVWGLDEVWILGAEMEGRVLKETIHGSEGRSNRVFDGSGLGDGVDMGRKRKTSFEEKVERCVRVLEEATGWTAPEWRVLGCEDEDRDPPSPGIEAMESSEMREHCLGRKDWVHKQQNVPDDFKVEGNGTSRLVSKIDE